MRNYDPYRVEYFSDKVSGGDDEQREVALISIVHLPDVIFYTWVDLLDNDFEKYNRKLQKIADE
jgi:hypothetical protein